MVSVSLSFLFIGSYLLSPVYNLCFAVFSLWSLLYCRFLLFALILPAIQTIAHFDISDRTD